MLKLTRYVVVGVFLSVMSLIHADEPVSFEQQILPLLERRCSKCHHEKEQSGGLDLTRMRTMRRGGDELGAAVVPGDPDASPLIQVLTGVKKPAMPEGADPLPDEDIELLRRWIAEGARDDSTVFAPDDVEFFEREIRPVLINRCFKCHAGDELEHGLRLTSRQSILEGGSRGSSVVSGKPAESLLIKAIRHDGELKMPRGGDRLSDAQVAAFESWVQKGLPWPTEQRVLARERHFTISDADRSHWAFRSLPAELSGDWTIDVALQPHHARLGITPPEQADRHRLLRRVTYDLIGYPPTSEEIAAFVSDDSPDAYERVVARLLATPHFGWRWGQHWLDYTRNGSTGQPTRGPALDSARYAKWIAQCLNEDRPWDWMSRVHIAGDQMPGFEGAGYDVDQALAAAVPLNGPRTFNNIETETFVLMDKLDESIEFLGRSLMGISLECARCHDHKFDPISQRDYYALVGFFQSSGYAPVSIDSNTQDSAASAVAGYRELVAEKARLHGFIRRQGLLLNVGGGGRVKKWQETRPPILAPMHRRLLELELGVLVAELAAVEKRGDMALASDFKNVIAAREEQRTNPIEAEYNISTFKEMGYFISGHKSQLGLINRAKAVQRNRLVAELEEQACFWEDERLRWGERSQFGGFARTDPEVAELRKAADRIAAINAQLPGSPEQPWVAPPATHLYVRTDGGLRRAEDLVPFDEMAKAAGLQFNSDNANRVFLHPRYVGDARLLNRGDVLEPGELVPRGFPVFFGEESPELIGSGRLELAEWLTRADSIQSALVARTAVNRVWQHLFGKALCRTPKELGRLGETPELPEVIDGLAQRFIHDGWSMKKLIHRIVMSDAYRRSAVAGAEDYLRDPDNRLFTHQNVRRLDYEATANTFHWLLQGNRNTGPVVDVELAKHFDAPSHYDLTERRVESITPTQALFLMNNLTTAQRLCGNLIDRLGFTPSTKLEDALPSLYLTFFQRPPTMADREFAANYLRRRRTTTGREDPLEELRELASLLLCANETYYFE
ncbi:MAG: PSD1 domain-containing protein [Planctomycetaceae bacterium]|nr:PSD1 domain-containing protein [Planctomycetales bacterium]MCB9924139.1 PSD1 domain-containing protein [Planctomycetaceae bacterium]